MEWMVSQASIQHQGCASKGNCAAHPIAADELIQREEQWQAQAALHLQRMQTGAEQRGQGTPVIRALISLALGKFASSENPFS
jgi:hypothetical protein